jgi:hypothetical protein
MSEYCNNCFCCGCYLVPRYKRLVNNVFPQNPQVKKENEKVNKTQILFLFLFSMDWIKIILNDYVFMRLLNLKNLINHFVICRKKSHDIYVIEINRKILLFYFKKSLDGNLDMSFLGLKQ